MYELLSASQVSGKEFQWLDQDPFDKGESITVESLPPSEAVMPRFGKFCG